MVLMAETEEDRIDKDFVWLTKTTPALQEKYEGKWIAIVKKKVVGVGKNAKEAYVAAKKVYPDKEPLMEFVPRKGLLVL